MRINNNVMALNAHRQLGVNQAGAGKSMEKLSSGFRINRAGDDAAGLAISEKMRGQIRGLKQATRNAQDGISLIQTAEGALNETHAILQRMRELAVQAASDTNTESDRAALQLEVDQLASEIDRIADTTEFNTMKLLNGEFETERYFHIGANSGQNVDLTIDSIRAEDLGVNGAGIFDGEILTTANESVAGVSAQDVLKDDGEQVAVKIGADWYAIGDVEATKSSGGINDVLAAKTDAQPLTVTEGKTIDGMDGLFTEGKATVAGVSGTDVLMAGDEVVAVQIGPDWFAIDNVQDDGSGTLEAINAADTLDVDDGYVLGAGGEGAGLDISTTREAADAALEKIDAALNKVSDERSKLGAMQNRLEHTIANLGTSAENLQAAESRIRDLDMADEIMEFTKNNILQQAATAMLAQANMAPQSVLQLLG